MRAEDAAFIFGGPLVCAECLCLGCACDDLHRELKCSNTCEICEAELGFAELASEDPPGSLELESV